MRRAIFVFAIVASLLMLSCAAADGKEKEKSSAEVLFDGMTGTVKEIAKLFFQGGTASSFTMSNAFGVLDDEVEQIKRYGKHIEVLHQQSVQENKDIESIRALVQAAAEKVTESGALTQITNFIAARAETAKTQISEIEKHRKTGQIAIADAEAAKKDILKKEAELMAMFMEIVTAIPSITAARSVGSPDSDPLKLAMMKLVTDGVPIVADLYSSSKKFNKASVQSRKAFQEAKLASKTIKKYLKESTELQKSLKPQS